MSTNVKQTQARKDMAVSRITTTEGVVTDAPSASS